MRVLKKVLGRRERGSGGAGALCLTIVGIPFGLESIKLGVVTMTPFGMEIIPSKNGGGALRPVFDIIWLVLFGSRIAVGYLVSAVLLGITIIGASGFRPATSQAAPPGAVPLGARTAPVVTVCPRIAARVRSSRWLNRPSISSAPKIRLIRPGTALSLVGAHRGATVSCSGGAKLHFTLTQHTLSKSKEEVNPIGGISQ